MLTVDPAILVYAFRYALGRSTYAAGDVRHAVERNLDRMPERDRALMADEIRAALRDGQSTPASDRDEWAALADRLEVTLPAALIRSGR